MMIDEDINEKNLYSKHPRVLELLLLDQTTRKNIIWATDSYKRRGYRFNDSICISNVIAKNVIVPRSKKSKSEQSKRSKDNAEVFTPSWICNIQNNLVDNEWFGKIDVFNTEGNKSWETNTNKIEFPEGKTWMDYVKDIRLEISCGEAPYVVSRYDSVSGEPIDIKDRIGLFDRKMRVINENAASDEEWIDFSIIALKSVYGFEWQGDNLVLARENVLYSYIDYYQARFNEEPDEELLIQVVTIISWNFWQMDGIKCVIPNSCKTEKIVQYNLFGEEDIIETGCIGCEKGDVHMHNGIYSKIMDWEKNKKTLYVNMIKGGYL